MARFGITIAPDALRPPSPGGESAPLFQRIAWAIADEIRRGRLTPGAALPSSRKLATELGVNRNTVIAAYADLRAEGWIEALPGGTTTVARTLAGALPARPQPFAPTRLGVPLETGFDLPEAAPEAGWPSPDAAPLLLAGGYPDLRLLPVAELSRAWRAAITRHAGTLLSYGDSRGDSRLRAALADMLAALRGLATTAEDVMVVRGSQMALDLVARTLLRPGDVVLVEALGYRPAWAAFEAAGARVVPLPVDASGLRTDLIAGVLAAGPVRAVYVTPHHQYPTTVTLSAARRLQLLALCAAHRVAVIEDDYDHEFHFEGRPVLPLASADPAGVVVYVGTLSKVLAPGLRIGFIVAPGALLERLAEVRKRVDRQGDLVTERAVAELLEDGEIQRHVRRMRRLYAGRRDALAVALRAELGSALTFEVPNGGMSLWALVDDDLPVEALAAAALRRGVGVHVGRRFTRGGAPLQALRLGYGALDEADLREAARRLGVAAVEAGRGARADAGRGAAGDAAAVKLAGQASHENLVIPARRV